MSISYGLMNVNLIKTGREKAEMFQIVVNVIGALGIIASIISFQCKKHGAVVTFRTVNELLFAVQYLLLGAYTGMAMNLIGCVRNTIFTHMVKKGKNTFAVCIVFSVLFTAFSIATWSGPKSILIGAAKVISTFAYGNKNTTIVRLLILITSSTWLFYNLCVGSYAGVLCEAFTLCSIVVGIIRIDIVGRRRGEKAATGSKKDD